MSICRWIFTVLQKASCVARPTVTFSEHNYHSFVAHSTVVDVLTTLIRKTELLRDRNLRQHTTIMATKPQESSKPMMENKNGRWSLPMQHITDSIQLLEASWPDSQCNHRRASTVMDTAELDQKIRAITQSPRLSPKSFWITRHPQATI
jgi:hypothetical protein